MTPTLGTRKPLSSQSKEIVFNLIKYFKDVNDKNMSSVTTSAQLVATSTGIPLSTVYKISSEGKRALEHGNKLRSPKKSKCRKRIIAVSDSDKAVIRETIRNFHITNGGVLTMKRLLKKLKNEINYSGSIWSLRKEVSLLGFKWKKTEDNRKILVDELSDSSLISDPEETSGAPGPSGPDVGPQTLSVVFLCKACSKNITSFRYRCLVCPDYDMCGECEGRGGHHDDHYVLRVPMQRPTLEVDQVESAVRRALSSSTTWNTAFKSTAKSGDTVIKPEITLHESGTTERVAGSVDEPEVKVELVIKEEVDPLEEEAAASAFLQNIYERQTTSGSKDVSSTQVVPSYHVTQASQGVPWSFNVPLTQGAPQSLSVPPAQDVPPSKRRRADEHRSTTTTHSHKTTPTTNEPTGRRETCPSSTAATSLESGSKVDVFVLKKRTRPADENYD